MPTAASWLQLLSGSAILVALPALAFVSACGGLRESDFWWHQRAGEWILENGRVPDRDPFTYGSADELWIDLHWLFQVVQAALYRRAGAVGAILLCATLAGLSVLVGLAAGRKSASRATVALCWVPALVVLSLRLPLRPEMVTLLACAIYLAVLVRVQERPRLAWVLPAVQLVWVNAHGLFIFGPAILMLWWLDFGARWAWQRCFEPAVRVRVPWHLGAASVAVGLACLLNPYGVRGALFPWVLYPKVTQAGNPYRAYIDEFHTPAHIFAVEAHKGAIIAHDYRLYQRSAFFLLLLLLPLSFMVPVAWRISRSASTPAHPPLPALFWPAVFLGALALVVLHLACLTPRLSTGLWLLLGRAVPWAFLASSAGAVYLLRRKDPAAGLWLAGSLALALWTWWLDDYFATTPTRTALLWLLAPLALYVVVRDVRSGGSLFAVLLVGAFGYLALSAINSIGRFALVAAIVLAWNLGAWTAQLGDALGSPWGPRAALAARPAVAGGLVLYLAAMIAAMPAVPGHLTRDAFVEPPLLYPHDAARFAGGAGMPQHALAYGLPAANTFVYHNAPEKLVYLDARLEVPRRETFLRYRDIDDLLTAGKAGWADAVAEVGNPALLLAHEDHDKAEAAVLVHPEWRLVYFDALASVFLHRPTSDAAHQVPTLDLAARHFTAGHAPSVPPVPGSAAKEMIALANLGTALCAYPQAAWDARIPTLLSAVDRAELALVEGANLAPVWMLIGTSCWALRPDLASAPSEVAHGWNLYADLRWAQLTYGLRRAQQLKAGDARFATELYRIFRARKMGDALRSAGARLLALEALDAKEAAAVRQRLESIPPPRAFSEIDRAHASQLCAELIRTGRPEDAVRLAEAVGAEQWCGWAWEDVDLLANACLQLGFPGQARTVWQRAAHVPSEALRACRVAATFWVERDLTAAAQAYEAARQTDPGLPEPFWALAWIDTERGQAAAALDRLGSASSVDLPAQVRTELAALAAFLRRYVPAAPAP